MINEMVENAWANIGYFLWKFDSDIRRLVRGLNISKKKLSGIQPNMFR